VTSTTVISGESRQAAGQWFLRLQPNPIMDEICVEIVAQRDDGNRGARFGALLNESGFEGFEVLKALWLHERPA
jgi:hypothetical protein